MDAVPCEYFVNIIKYMHFIQVVFSHTFYSEFDYKCTATVE